MLPVPIAAAALAAPQAAGADLSAIPKPKFRYTVVSLSVHTGSGPCQHHQGARRARVEPARDRPAAEPAAAADAGEQWHGATVGKLLIEHRRTRLPRLT
jgi:hypothetical protein